MQDLIRALETLSKDINAAMAKLGISADQKQAEALRAETAGPDFWSDPLAASEISKKLAALDRHVSSWTDLQHEIAEALELAKLEQGSSDTDLANQIRALYEAAQT